MTTASATSSRAAAKPVDITKGEPPSSRRVLNPLAAIVVSGIVIVGWLGLSKLHSVQLGRTQDFLKASAYAALEKQEYREARKRLAQYLSMKPYDLEARERLSMLLANQVGTRSALEQAFGLNEDLLRSGNSSPELRLTQARIASDLGLHADAEAHLQVLSTLVPDLSEVWLLSGRAAVARRDAKSALAHFQRAIDCDAPQPDAFLELATLLDGGDDADRVGEVLELLTQRCEPGKALQLRADWLMKHDRPQEAVADLEALLVNDPGNERVQTMHTHCLQRLLSQFGQTPELAKTLNTAVTRLKQEVTNQPSSESLRLCLASLLWSRKEQSAAIETLEAGIRNSARSWTLHQALIEYLTATGDAKKARRSFAALPQGVLPRSTMLFLEGRVLMSEKDWHKAELSLSQAIAFADPQSDMFGRLQMSAALCRSRAGRTDDAVNAFRSLVESDPNSQAARLGIAAARVQSGQMELAIAEYRQMLEVPGVPAYLADLLIRHNLQLPDSVRNWQEVDRLTREIDPVIADPVQRALLRVDRLFASGEMLDGLAALEGTRDAFSEQSNVLSAINKFQRDDAGKLRATFESLVEQNPHDAKAVAGLLSLQLAAGEVTAVEGWIEKAARGENGRDPQRTSAVSFAVDVLDQLATLQACSRKAVPESIESQRVSLLRELAAGDPRHLPRLAMLMARQRNAALALQEIDAASPPQVSTSIRGAALCAVVQSASRPNEIASEVLRRMYDLIQRDPASGPLRLFYADALIAIRAYPDAETTLATVVGDTPEASIAEGRRIALLIAQNSRLDEAGDRLRKLMQLRSGIGEFSDIQARLDFVRHDFAAVMERLQSVPADQRALSSTITLAAALRELHRDAEACTQLAVIRGRLALEPLSPLDADLLTATISDRPALTRR